MPKEDHGGDAPDANFGLTRYFILRKEIYAVFASLSHRERWYVLSSESRILVFYAVGVLLARMIFSIRTSAQAVVLTANSIFGMTPLEVGVLTYWSLHAFMALMLLAIVLHILFAARPHPWARDTATFLFGFITHTAVPYPAS